MMNCSVFMSTPKRSLYLFLDIGTCATVFTHVPVTYHSYPTQMRRQQRQHDTRYIQQSYCRLVLLPTACCRSSTFICTGQRLVRARVVVVCLWSYLKEALCNCPFGIVVAFFSSIFIFFKACFVQPKPTLGLYETNENDSTSDTYV